MNHPLLFLGGGRMANNDDFWQRPVTETVSVELLPGDRPCLQISQSGQAVLELELLQARALIEVLNVAVGELFILKRDPAAMARVRQLLAEDVTLDGGEGDLRSTSADSCVGGQVHAQELIRRYSRGERGFAGADLRYADLQGADLREVDLRQADLSAANLKRANLFRANLEEANLSQADLEEAGLYQANLRGTDLSRANLRRAFLNRADLTDAQVSAEQLAQAQMLRDAKLPDSARPT